MGLLQKLKSVLGLNGTESSGSGRSGDVDVTVEREPSTESEDAVKGTETSSRGETDDAGANGSEADSATEEADATVDAGATDSETADEATEETEPDADSATEEEDATVDGSTDPVTELNGIGPAYADRLAGVGIETVGELAAADPAAVADEIDLGESRVAGWVEQAESY